MSHCAATRRFACWAANVTLFACLASCRVEAPVSQPTPLPAVTYESTQLTFDGSAPLTASFTAPNGQTLRTTSFASAGRQLVRFTPTQSGLWRYEVMAQQGVVAAGKLDVTQGKSHGFVRARGRAFEFGDGTPFIAIGENRINIYDPAWNWNALSIPEYVKYMAEHGMSVLRVFVVSDVQNEEKGGVNPGVLEPELGKFDEQVAAQFDEIFRAAEQHDVYVVLVAFALGFSQDDAWKSWQDNPYALERGGPAATRYDFFESPAVRARAAARIRYLAARYASSPNLLAIDLLNEPEWDGAIPEVSWTSWAREMARIWDEADPYDHLVTVGSVGLHWNIEGDERDWWQSDACSVVQWHLYGKETYDVHALAAEMTRKVRETWHHDRPVLIGEFAYGGEPKPEYDHTHVGLWSAVFSGAAVLAHSAPPFTEDSDEFMTPERARHFRVLRSFLERLPALAPVDATATSGVMAWAMHGRDAAAVWLLAPKKDYGKPTSEVRVVLRGLDRGRWRVSWVDDVTGTSLTQSEAQQRDGTLTLHAPAFAKHIAARLERLPEGDGP